MCGTQEYQMNTASAPTRKPYELQKKGTLSFKEPLIIKDLREKKMEKYNDFGITYQNLLTGRKRIFTSSLSYLFM